MPGPLGEKADGRGALRTFHADHGATFETESGVVAYVREVLSSVLAVLLVGLVLFAVSGLWPPMVAVESPSMKPHMTTGDLVFVMEEHRFPGGAAYDDTGVVTHRTGERTGPPSPAPVLLQRLLDGEVPLRHAPG